jgi:hypothetical protein
MSSKLREALEEADTVLSALGYDANTPIRTQIKQALAEPPKNCEVGTAEEQAKRFKHYCDNKVCKRRVCHSYGYENLFHYKCFPIWSQMPYEEDEVKI